MTIKLEYETFQAVRVYARNRATAPGSGACAVRDKLTAWANQSEHGVQACFGQVCRWLLDAWVHPPEVGLENWKLWLEARNACEHFRNQDALQHPMSGWFAFQNGAVWFVDHLQFAEAIERDFGDWFQAVQAGRYTTSKGIYFQAARHGWVWERE